MNEILNHPAYHSACGRIHYNACPAIWAGSAEVPDGVKPWGEQEPVR